MPFFRARDGAKLHFTDEGNGLPVIALAGLTRNGSDFDYVAPHLSNVRLIRLDYRGRGRSPWTGTATYTIPVEAGDTIALMDHLGLDRAAILGTSRGGLIGMVLAAMARPRLSGVALVDVGPELAPEGLDVIRGYLGRNPSARTLAEAAAASQMVAASLGGLIAAFLASRLAAYLMRLVALRPGWPDLNRRRQIALAWIVALAAAAVVLAIMLVVS